MPEYIKHCAKTKVANLLYKFYINSAILTLDILLRDEMCNKQDHNGVRVIQFFFRFVRSNSLISSIYFPTFFNALNSAYLSNFRLVQFIRSKVPGFST